MERETQTHTRVDGGTDRQIGRYMHGWLGNKQIQKDEIIYGWMDGQMDGCYGMNKV